MAYTNINETPLKRYPSIPDVWNNTINYKKTDEATLKADGWKIIIIPPYNEVLEFLTYIIYIKAEDKATYYIKDKGVNRVQEELIRSSEARKIKAHLAEALSMAEALAQEASDEESLKNQDSFPIWKFPFDYTVGFKCQHFTDENELILFRCIEAHTSKESVKPKDSEYFVQAGN